MLPAARVALLAAGGAALIGTLYVADPAVSPVYPPCLFHALTGLSCPGCGTLRALHQLLHARPLAALRLNPLIVLWIPLAAWGLASLRFDLADAPPARLLRHPTTGRVLLGVVLIFWLGRNLIDQGAITLW